MEMSSTFYGRVKTLQKSERRNARGGNEVIKLKK